MKSLPHEIVAEAFALSNARGTELLVRLGKFDVWRGDLAAMRRDDPRGPEPQNDPQRAGEEARFLLDRLVLARAIELLSPVCRATLSAVYAEGKDALALANDRDAKTEDAERIVSKCEEKLIEIYESLIGEREPVTLPHWVSEREQVAIGGQRR